MEGYNDKVRKIYQQFLNALERKEKSEMLLLSNKWGIVEKAVEQKIDTLIKTSLEKELSRNQLYQLDEYRELLLVSQREVKKFNLIASETIKDNQQIFLESGLKSSQLSIQLLKININKVSINSINTIIGFTKDGTPLFDILKSSYPETITKLTNTLIESTALGRNPIETARLMKVDMQGNLNRALRIARTEQMNCFRTASNEQMKASGVVKGWHWLAEKDACEYCLEKANRVFSFDIPFDTHPNCRCANCPYL